MTNVATIRMKHKTASGVVINKSDRAAYEAQGFEFDGDVSSGDSARAAGSAAAAGAAATAGAGDLPSGQAQNQTADEGKSNASGAGSDTPHGGEKVHTAKTYPYDRHSKPELVEMATRLGVPIGDGATKADLIGLLRGADFVPGVNEAGGQA